jgi:hypothetical protein
MPAVELQRLTRAEHVVVVDFLRLRAHAITARAGKSRGYIETDAAGVASKVTTLVIGNALGLRIKRVAALANGHVDYYDAGGTILISS